MARISVKRTPPRQSGSASGPRSRRRPAGVGRRTVPEVEPSAISRVRSSLRPTARTRSSASARPPVAAGAGRFQRGLPVGQSKPFRRPLVCRRTRMSRSPATGAVAGVTDGARVPLGRERARGEEDDAAAPGRPAQQCVVVREQAGAVHVFAEPRLRHGFRGVQSGHRSVGQWQTDLLVVDDQGAVRIRKTARPFLGAVPRAQALHFDEFGIGGRLVVDVRHIQSAGRVGECTHARVTHVLVAPLDEARRRVHGADPGLRGHEVHGRARAHGGTGAR